MTMAASDHRGTGKGFITQLAARLAAARLALILLLMAISLAVAATVGWRWFAASRDNATIRKLVAGENVEIDPHPRLDVVVLDFHSDRFAASQRRAMHLPNRSRRNGLHLERREYLSRGST